MKVNIQGHLKEISNLYRERKNQKIAALSKMDFLSYIAIHKELKRICRPPICPAHNSVIKRFLKNPKKFIDDSLGKDLTKSRRCFELKAQTMLKIAMPYFNVSVAKMVSDEIMKKLQREMLSVCPSTPNEKNDDTPVLL
ncbi:MAG: hypothetical protein ABIE74_05005 [Pseudomonadota bacterium]